MCVHPHGVGGVSGISENYADFTGTAGMECVCVLQSVHMRVSMDACVNMWLHVYWRTCDFLAARMCI